MRRVALSILLALEVCMPNGSAGGAGERPPTNAAEIVDHAAPVVTISVEPVYLVGFPMIVAITLTNATAGTTWYDLPGAGLFGAPGPVQFTFSGPGGRRIELPTRSLRTGEGPVEGFTLEPGQARTMLFDISELNPPLTPGSYQLESVYQTRRGSYRATTVPVTIEAPGPSDAAAAGRLRAAHNGPDPSWSRFLDTGRADVPEVDLSPQGWRALAFHEAVHRAVYGKAPLKEIDPGLFDGFAPGPLEGESLLIRLELWHARGDRKADKLRKTIQEQWPGLLWRLAEIDAGRGWLAELRKDAGTDRR